MVVCKTLSQAPKTQIANPLKSRSIQSQTLSQHYQNGKPNIRTISHHVTSVIKIKLDTIQTDTSNLTQYILF
jgi:hypothetical protein